MGLAQGGIGAGIVLSILLMPPLFLAVGLTGAYAVFPVDRAGALARARCSRCRR